MAGHSRPKDGVASARLCPAIHVLARMQRKAWMPGTSPGMTSRDVGGATLILWVNNIELSGNLEENFPHHKRDFVTQDE
jgi:hypothetical protein